MLTMMREGIKLLTRISKVLVERHQKKPLSDHRIDKIRDIRRDLLDLRTCLGEITEDED